MSARHIPKTLAKIISYIIYESPAESGLFWGRDGTMPWKELYWSMQEDPSLRFVREAHVKEITLLGLDLPATLEGGILRLKPGYPAPSYPVADQPPERLYYCCRRKSLPVMRLHGLAASGRPFIPLAADKELALRIGRRRDPEPVLIEVEARKASLAGITFLQAGPELYLTQSVPAENLICPLVREGETRQTAAKKKKEKSSAQPETAATPGSFFMSSDQLRDSSGEKTGAVKGKRKGKAEDDWKRQSRKERHKRSL
jgi:putative RNA 2'-phosphotransferase